MIGKPLVFTAALMALGPAAACSSQEDSADSRGKPVAAASPAKGLTVGMVERGREIYKTNCVVCHGETGKGDGPAARVLNPKPRDQSDSAYMSTLSDQEIADVIRMGGALKGRPLMPGHPNIDGEDMNALVAYIRTLSAPKR